MLVRLDNGKVIGEINQGVFRKNVEGSKHMLRNPQGWAINLDVLEKLRQYRCVTIEVYDREGGIKYTVSLQSFEMYAETINRGFGIQKVLPILYWQSQKE